MILVDATIRGIPYPKTKAPPKAAAEQWSAQVVAQTRHLPHVKQPCAATITFYLPPSRFSADLPTGPDLDNLLKRFLDALNETVLLEAPGKDSCIVQMSASKVQVGSEDEGTGARVRLRPASLDTSSKMDD